MKNLILIVFLLFSIPSFSQIIVSGVDINKSDNIKVCTIEMIAYGYTSDKFDVFLDYGQKTKKSTTQITDLAGKTLTFNSSAAVLNHMENNGWQHYDSQILMDRENVKHHYYYFRKTK
ncbi:hypothetical protein [Dyadobacter sp. LHD-138]|uniref:hypothetical protein n=1 Tax=Dyadobacter sp. LHD-138 TaxID=3071413 RepID=UPI0027DEBCB6|nr:hypothetical protein [Dyadobacter sp. LHD-138]MDQ6481485.1 hypothetical protein [Dyadobacter sp. LHD-138]